MGTQTGTARWHRTAVDADLVAWAVHGDEGAFAELDRRHRPAVAALVRSDLRSSADAADVVQEVFLTAWRRLSTLRDPQLVRAWLLQISRRAVIDHVRWTGRRPDLRHDDDAAIASTATSAPGPEDLAEMSEMATRLAIGLDGLSARDATAITLAVQFGFGPAEIGTALGITPNNAKVVLHRARTRLRSAIE